MLDGNTTGSISYFELGPVLGVLIDDGFESGDTSNWSLSVNRDAR